MTDTAYIFLDPDGTSDPGLFVIVHARTGVYYASRCSGICADERAAEGFLVPLSAREHASCEQALQRDFHIQALASLFRPFGSDMPSGRDAWSAEFLDALDVTLSDIVIWEGSSKRTTLRLDRSRLAELTEAWVPVVTPYGAGTLTFHTPA